MVERYQTTSQTSTEPRVLDAGLRAYMLKVYNYMASGVLLTGIVAMLISQSDAALQMIFGSGLSFVVMLAPFAFVMVLSFGVNRLSASTLQMIFWAYAATMGLSLSIIFVQYTGASIARTFFVTAAAFGSLSLYGYTTKKVMSGFGSFLFMGLIGLVIASVVNIFLGSTMLEFIISVAGLLIFAGLTAYDTQRIKHEYYDLQATGFETKGALMAALSLYLNFINMFLFLLRLMGSNRE